MELRQEIRRDPAIYFFGVVAILCLIVSLPATKEAMELFHGAWWGVAAMVVFEIGAVGSELATLAIPHWKGRLTVLTILLLLVTSATNYAMGIDQFSAAKVLPGTTYAKLQEAGWGPQLAVAASAMFPTLLFVFLTAFTARVRMVGKWIDREHQLSTRLGEFLAERDKVNSEAEVREQSLVDREHQLNSREQRANISLNEREHQLNSREQFLAEREHQVGIREQQVVEMVRIAVAGKTYTQKQLADVFDTSVMTVRRRLELIEPAIEMEG